MKNAICTIFLAAGLSAVQADEMAAALALGAQKNMLCIACHGPDGKGIQPVPGMAMAPNLLESELLKGSGEILTAILMRGIKKEKPTEYMGQQMMALGATLTNEELAALVTYHRKQYGGIDELTTAEQVAEWRKKYPTEKGQISRSELQEMLKAES